MYFTPIAPMKLEGVIKQDILERAELICIESAKLIGNYDTIIIKELINMLRIVNCYYSNKIESEGTHPLNIEKAMKKEYSPESKAKELQNLAIAYINTQTYLGNLNKDMSPFDTEYLKKIHQHFYSGEGMEHFLTMKDGTGTIDMIPGDLRKRNVKVGNHIPISPDKLETMMSSFQDLYKNATKFGTKASKLVYILASHHRLVWIHPFLDGNGRVSRLVLDALMHYIGIKGYGLWNISRGLARNNAQYKNLLAHADEKKTNDYDGRGILSNKGLEHFVNYMLDTAIDQIKYMKHQLQLSTLSQRVENYVKESQIGSYYGIKPLPKHSEKLLKELLIKGEIKRGEVKNIIGTKNRIASSLIKELLEREYIKSDTPRGNIRLIFGTHFAMKIFPELIPAFNQ